MSRLGPLAGFIHKSSGPRRYVGTIAGGGGTLSLPAGIYEYQAAGDVWLVHGATAATAEAKLLHADESEVVAVDKTTSITTTAESDALKVWELT